MRSLTIQTFLCLLIASSATFDVHAHPSPLRNSIILCSSLRAVAFHALVKAPFRASPLSLLSIRTPSRNLRKGHFTTTLGLLGATQYAERTGSRSVECDVGHYGDAVRDGQMSDVNLIHTPAAVNTYPSFGEMRVGEMPEGTLGP